MAVNATAIWRVRPSGSNTNGGGYDPGIAGAATDYSQQNAAQATGTLGTASGTATFTDAGGAFTAAMVGNALWIASGAGFTVGAYFIVTFNSATSVVLDRSPGTGSVAHWALGGGWADFWTNTNQTANQIVPGNTVFILGSGTPNPSSYVYDYDVTGGAFFYLVVGNQTNGTITFANDPATPGYKSWPDTTGGMPVIKSDQSLRFDYCNLKGLWFVINTAPAFFYGNNATSLGCVFDQFGNAIAVNNGSPNGCSYIGCEIFSSVAVGAVGGAILIGTDFNFFGCNIHDTTMRMDIEGVSRLIGNIFAKSGDGTRFLYLNSTTSIVVANNTFDGNAGNAIELLTQIDVAFSIIFNNIISNHTAGGAVGIKCDAGTTAQNDQIKKLIDYNTFYNNTSNYNAISAGTHDTALGVTPYVASTTENYTLA
jgi:hypothetical protein